MPTSDPLPEGWPTLEGLSFIPEHTCCDCDFSDALNAAEWAVRAYPALVALVERLRVCVYEDNGEPNFEAWEHLGDVWRDVRDWHKELASILALAKETKE